ncbi:hypothetical protein VF14_31800 [Nostoc linckia z18]|uniref:Uncharacterized protein n=2 Tax=Nostoc linckia TaxID=92942 RepID=A0A9Q5Z5U7_NOSLI|nr:hypothetical protein [Nostoc linckia]PHK34609.1 hypothetical protein VF12_23550 [Nostoc linckia z15]PHK41172.1 hypothetical protein VF13_31655 [Nostoc linckia z16]PHJ55780.1 hypothetical protein VF02_35415 [Nostoc linckia z1]PHJ56994.1 hypothetical protein VF05_36435 [Nostoc linckia z3]PHJ58288.1 hypothetical protein VF03_35620 [Nostoc linckia z2]
MKLEDSFLLTLRKNNRSQKIDGCGWEDTFEFSFKNAKEFALGDKLPDSEGIITVFGLDLDAKVFKK